MFSESLTFPENDKKLSKMLKIQEMEKNIGENKKPALNISGKEDHISGDKLYESFSLVFVDTFQIHHTKFLGTVKHHFLN